MAESSDSEDDIIVYQKGDDEMQDLGDQVNFSAAFKNRRLGDALCRSNPAASRKLDAKISEINKQQRRRKADLYQKQREFFINQIFAKGLNPFVNKGDSMHSLREPLSSREPPRVAPRVSFISTTDTESPPTKALHIVRSYTVGDIPTQLGAMKPSASNSSGAQTYRDSRDHTWLIAPRRYQHLNDYDQPILPEPKVHHMPIHDRKLSPIKETMESVHIPALPNHKHLSDLKQYPNMLFPKMKVLLKETKDNKECGKMPLSPRDSVQLHRITLPQITAQTPDEEGQFGSKQVMKMIQNLSADLPHHLKTTATAQIRDMTNSDKIYEQKAQLKRDNLPWLRREGSLEDRRWFKLETSLWPAEGMGQVTWRRMSGSWTPCRRY